MVFKQKTCPSCSTEFTPNNGKQKYCHSCYPIKSREYIREYMQYWHVANHEHDIEYSRGYHQRLEVKEREREYDRRYGKIRSHTRRARINGNGGKLPNGVEDILFEAQEGICYLCGDLLYGRLNDPPTIEHKIPVSRGGSNDISNVALAHLSCNVKKGTKTHEEFLQAHNA